MPAIAGGLVLLCMLQSPGRLAADTKMDVVFEPWRFLDRALHLWNSSSDFGFLPNQYVGYLFPMGPFFGVGKALHVPPWVTQRLWMALLLTVAAWGLVRLADALGTGRPPTRVLAGLTYALSPMFLGKIGSTSVALTGAAMLPWIVLPLVLALRPDRAGGAVTGRAACATATGDGVSPVRRLSPRRAAAASGLAILATGGVNASVTLCVLLLPAVLLLFAGNTRRAWALRGWWVTAVVLATAWWVLALAVQSRYGLNFLVYTETAATTTSSASVGEAMRGTTDWMTYLRLPWPWLPAATEYVSNPAAIVGSGVVAAVGLFGLARRDLPARRFLLTGAAAGFVAVAAAYPGQPGGLFADGMRDLLSHQLGFLRNVYKFQPVVRVPLALGFAHALAVAASALTRPRVSASVRYAAAGVTIGAIVLGTIPALGGRVLPPGTFREVPDYWVQAADWLADNPSGGRTLVLPGTAFAEYSWGRPLDEPLQWLSETPWGVRSLIPLGGVGVTRWLDEIERQLALGSAPGLAVALARAGVGQVVVRNDLDNRDWDIPASSQQVRRALESSGLAREAEFGPMVPARREAKSRLVDENRLADETVPALEVWVVRGCVLPVTAYPARTAMVVSGGPEATVHMAAHGLLGPTQGVVLASDLADVGGDAADTTSAFADTGDTGDTADTGSPGTAAAEPPPDAPPAAAVLGPRTPWVATDTFDRRDYQFGLVHDATSYLLGESESPAGAAVPPRQWADRGLASHQTVAGFVDGMRVTASSYGSDLFQAPELAPGSAVDGLTDTAWQARRHPADGSTGQWIELDVGRDTRVSDIMVRLLQETERRPVVGTLRVTTQAGSAVTEVAPTEDEQRVAVPAGLTRWFRVSFERVAREGDAVLGAGIREIAIPGVRFQRYARVPTDLAPLYARPGAGPLAYSFDRERVDPSTPFGGDEERTIARRFEVPHAAEFRVTGTATHLLPGDRGRVPSGDTSLDTGCGGGPTINIDGVRLPTRITGRWADVLTLRRLPLTVCTIDGRGVITLGPGPHLLTVEQDPVYQTIDSISLVDIAIGRDLPRPRATQVTSWSPEQRAVQVGAGERALLAVKENANPSWTATLNGQTLTPIRLDGWQQGWILPAGEGGMVKIENRPGVAYRRNLLVGLAGVVLLVAMLATPARFRLRPRSDPDGVPRRLHTATRPLAALAGRLPGWAGPAVSASVAVAMVAGPVAVAVPALVVVARRRPAVLGWLACAGALAAVAAVVADPDSPPGSGAGAFSVHAQLAAAFALAATLAALAARPASREEAAAVAAVADPAGAVDAAAPAEPTAPAVPTGGAPSTPREDATAPADVGARGAAAAAAEPAVPGAGTEAVAGPPASPRVGGDADVTDPAASDEPVAVADSVRGAPAPARVGSDAGRVG